MLSKLESLSRCDRDFLLDFAKEVNLTYRFYSKMEDKEKLLRIIDNKFDSKAIDSIVKRYLLCYDAKEVAKLVIPDSVIEIFGTLPKALGDGDYIREVTLGARTCDVVLLQNDELIAIEIKSARDKVSRALKQLEYYKQWANKVYLAYDFRHGYAIKTLFHSDDIGLIECHEGAAEVKHHASHRELDGKCRLQFMTYKFLKDVAKKHKIKKTRKELMVRELSKSLSDEYITKLFCQFIFNSKTNPNKAAKQFAQNDQIYPLKLFSVVQGRF